VEPPRYSVGCCIRGRDKLSHLELPEAVARSSVKWNVERKRWETFELLSVWSASAAEPRRAPSIHVSRQFADRPSPTHAIPQATTTTTMAEGPLRFRTPHIEELPVTNSRHQPGFAWVAVKKDATDPSKAALEVQSKKRGARTTGGPAQTEAQREATSARQQREIERRIRDLNSDNTRDVNISIPKREHGGGSATKAGKTSNTKKILSSGKEFKHYLDDEEAELARTGKIDGLDRDPDAVVVQPVQRASKTPLARRALQREQSSLSGSPAPAGGDVKPRGLILPFEAGTGAGVGEDDDEFDGLPPLPTREEMQALLDAPPLTYNASRSAPGPASVAPRSFCELCGYWGRYKCLKCGAKTCSVDCEAVHVADRCLKFYA
jgi:zinc finger HIT domain-containing protein 1